MRLKKLESWIHTMHTDMNRKMGRPQNARERAGLSGVSECRADALSQKCRELHRAEGENFEDRQSTADSALSVLPGSLQTTQGVPQNAIANAIYLLTEVRRELHEMANES